MKNEAEAGRAIQKYADTVRRVCLIHLKDYHDVEDVFQDVFLKYVLYTGNFQSDAHEKAWFIRVSINACKDVLKSFLRRRFFSLEDIHDEPSYTDENDKEVLEAVLKLPEKYRDVVYLHYFEGYKAAEIAGILNKNENTVYTWLSRAKSMLKEVLGA